MSDCDNEARRHLRYRGPSRHVAADAKRVRARKDRGGAQPRPSRDPRLPSKSLRTVGGRPSSPGTVVAASSVVGPPVTRIGYRTFVRLPGGSGIGRSSSHWRRGRVLPRALPGCARRDLPVPAPAARAGRQDCRQWARLRALLRTRGYRLRRRCFPSTNWRRSPRPGIWLPCRPQADRRIVTG